MAGPCKLHASIYHYVEWSVLNAAWVDAQVGIYLKGSSKYVGDILVCFCAKNESN